MSTRAWRPGQQLDEDDDDAEEAAKIAAHAERAAAFAAEQAADAKKREAQQQAEEQAERQRRASEESANSEDGPSILDQLHLARGGGQRPHTQQQADGPQLADGEEPLATAPPAPSAGASLPSLKAQLRRFFLQIHPDLFEAHPREKEANARNLALLTDFLDALRGSSGGSSTSRHVGSSGHKTAQVLFWVRAKEKHPTPGTHATPAPGTPAPAATFYKINSTLTLQSASSGVAASRARAHAQLYTALSSLFKQAGLLHANSWTWGDEYSVGDSASAEAEKATETKKPAASSSPFGPSYDDEYFSRFTSAEGGGGLLSGEFESFVRSVRSAAAHYEHASKASRHEFLLRMANLRLQGVKVIFDDEWSNSSQQLVLSAYERVLQASKHFKPPKAIFTPAAPVADEAPRSPGSPGAPDQPHVPFSQTVQMPEGFSSMFAQIRKHQVKEGGPTTPAEPTPVAAPTGGASFESTRSPFSRVATVFSSSARRSHVDGRGRLVFALGQSERAWQRFLDADPQLIERALALQSDYRALKTLEKQVADQAGLFDLFAESAMLGDPDQEGGVGVSREYTDRLAEWQREAHIFRGLHTVFPEYHEISLRVSTSPTGDSPSTTPASECFTVDPTMGILLVPLHATATEIRNAILERGQECVQIRARHLEDVSDHAASLLHAKRHLKLRSLTASPSITRDQMREATERLSRVFGSLRDLLQGTNISVGEEYECLQEDGTLCIRWNWS